MADISYEKLAELVAQAGGQDHELKAEVHAGLGGENTGALAAQALSIVTDPSIDLGAGRTPDAAALLAAETVVRSRERPVLVIADNKVTEEFSGPESAVWRERIVDARERINAAIPGIGRIEVTNHFDLSWVGTGWLVDTDVIVTNRHVAVEFARRDTARFAFRSGLNGGPMLPRVDFLEEYQRAGASEFAIGEVLWIAPADGPDVAFLRVNRRPGQPRLARPLALASTIDADDWIATIGYPARDPRVPDQDLVRRLFGDVYDKKRLAPGRIIELDQDELLHDCSTLGGNSGSAIVSLKSGEAVGLHFSGLFMQANYAVPAGRIRQLLAEARRGGRDSVAPAPPPPPAQGGVVAGSPGVADGVTTRLILNVPIEITVRLATGAGGALAPVVGAGAVGTDPPATLDAAVAVAKAALAGDPDILNVRAGYRFRRGWITDERVVVVELREKLAAEDLASRGKTSIPSNFLGVGVDVRTAALPDQLEALGLDLGALERVPRPGGYREPPNLRLERVNERMQAIFHVSPDAGFPNLKAFIGRVDRTLTATMYEWVPNHISVALAASIGPGKSLRMVTQKKGTRAAVADLANKLQGRFRHTWASAGRGGLVPSAYHIKVASRDGKEFWLSSGNWKDSNQPNIDPAAQDSRDPVHFERHNREWHAIIAHAGLAKLFRDYIEWDFAEAQRAPVPEGLESELPDLFVPEVAFLGEERRQRVEYFDPLVIDRTLDVEPLLTPDRDRRGKRLFIAAATALVEEARDRILLQNQSFNLLAENLDEFEAFFRALQKKQADGLDVRIIFRDGREFGRENGPKQQALLERLKDFGFDTSRIRLQVGCHTKAIVVDSKTVLFGSHNFTNEGAVFNRDASLLIRDPEVARYFERILLHDWENRTAQEADEVVGGIRIARPDEPTPPGFRRVSGEEVAEAYR